MLLIRVKTRAALSEYWSPNNLLLINSEFLKGKSTLYL